MSTNGVQKERVLWWVGIRPDCRVEDEEKSVFVTLMNLKEKSLICYSGIRTILTYMLLEPLPQKVAVELLGAKR